MDTSTRRLIAGGALLTFAVHLVFNGRYGFFRDELYFIACGEHLAWGYVDQPPLIALAARIATTVSGESLWAFRLLANAAAAALVALTGVLAHRLGGGRFAVVLAMVAIGIAPDSMNRGHLLTMNVFEPVLWLGMALVLAGILQTGNVRAWPWVGVLTGLGLLNKYSTAFYVAALLVGLLLTPQRRLLRSGWFALAAGIAAVMVAPNVAWQAAHGWPMLELLRNGQLYKNAPFDPAGFFVEQVLTLGPVTSLVIAAGLWAFLRDERARPFRALGLAAVAGEVLFVMMKGKAYYATPLLPPLLVAGALAVERVLGQRTALRGVTVGLVVATSAVGVPLAVPVLPPDGVVRYVRALGIEMSGHERKEYRDLPQHFADQFGWQELTAAVGAAWASLPEARRPVTGLYVQNYGEAGALDFFGHRYGLPPARSGHNQYFFWGEQLPPVEALLILGGDPEDHREVCGGLEQIGQLPPHPYVMPYEDQLPIFHCTDLRRPLAEVWPTVKDFN